MSIGRIHKGCLRECVYTNERIILVQMEINRNDVNIIRVYAANKATNDAENENHCKKLHDIINTVTTMN